MECAAGQATHAVVGINAQGAAGVLCWQDNEFDAYKYAKEVKAEGGSAEVVDAPGGDLSDSHKDKAQNMALSIF